VSNDLTVRIEHDGSVMMHQGIPTTYRDRNYRSRLEARWAAMLDLTGWKYEYEPYDLPGWIPDFLICNGDKEILVEVKPFIRPDQFDTEKIINALTKAGKRDVEVLLLGCCLDCVSSVVLDGHVPTFAANAFAGGENLWAQAGNMVQWRRL
jgi:predicted nuclease of restriction endonuclease-like RecB superfamily